MKTKFLLLAAAGVTTVTLCVSRSGDAPSPVAKSNVDPARLAVALTGNGWTTDKVMIATGTLTNNNRVPAKPKGVSQQFLTECQSTPQSHAGALRFPLPPGYRLNFPEK